VEVHLPKFIVLHLKTLSSGRLLYLPCTHAFTIVQRVPS
jgi:hypothetical protein